MFNSFNLAWFCPAPACYLTSGVGGLLFYCPEKIGNQ